MSTTCNHSPAQPFAPQHTPRHEPGLPDTVLRHGAGSLALRDTGVRRVRIDVRCKSSWQPSHAKVQHVDVAVIGAGIIGLCVTKRLLEQPGNLSVALIERQQPCAGATGAGQGYIWMAHRNPRDEPCWQLAQASNQLWRDSMLSDGGQAYLDPAELQWQENGSLLLAQTPAEVASLQHRAQLLGQHGTRSRFMDAAELRSVEPAVALPPGGGGLLVECDAQLNGREAAQALLRQCRHRGVAGGRLVELMDEPVTAMKLSPCGLELEEVQTATQRVTVRRGAVLAAGAWTGQMLADMLGDLRWEALFRPRRGHLLCLQSPAAMPPLRHGMMEMGYAQVVTCGLGCASSACCCQALGRLEGCCQHPEACHTHHSGVSQEMWYTQHYEPAAGAGDEAANITFTATQHVSGNLLLGSSREFAGFSTMASSAIVKSILERAAHFLPNIAMDPIDELRLQHMTADAAQTRVGLRPFVAGGRPIIGPLGDVQNVFVAAGHEGSGLTLGPATAEIISTHIAGGSMSKSLNPQLSSAFLPELCICDLTKPESHVLQQPI